MIIGIDLGTTNSAVAIWRDGASVLVPNGVGDFLTPSAVSVAEDGTILVGMAARERQSTHPHLTSTAFKRLIGTQQKVRLGSIELDAERLSALVLRSLKEDAEAFAGIPVTGAVITVPAYFNDRQRKATRRAGELAGLPVARLVNEPTAAALGFGINERADREPFLVFDLGGGTFDVSVVEIFDNIVEVRASAGDNRLGGEDFNDALVDLARGRLSLDRIAPSVSPVTLSALLGAAAERCRRQLSEQPAATFSITLGDRVASTEITAVEFEEHAASLIARLREPVLRSLRDSDLRVDALSDIVLVGGATRMPLVRRVATKMFGRFPNASVHPDHAVALGAGVQAGLLARDAALDEVRLTDVCPFTLGIEHAQWDGRGQLRTGLFSPIIERNTAIPVSRVGSYGTVGDNQRRIEVSIYQGEARNVSGNVKLGTIDVPVPPRPAGEIEIECRFSYDSNGLLEVDVSVPSTGITRNLVILDESDSVSPSELEKRRASLARLKFHPREQAENAALLARATRCFETFIGERRHYVSEWITLFEAALDSQDERTIKDARAELTARLDSLEGERFL
jgi:molecular chaperone HscC